MTAYVHTSTRICRVLIGLAILWGIIGLAVKSGYTGIQEGVSAYRRGDYATALQEWSPLAQQGNTAAQYNLGLLYEYGYGVLQDYQQAAQWFRRAAEQGNARAQAALGWLYEYGDGVPQDYQQAVQWYRWAVEQGNPWAQYNLGSMYEYGKGVPKDDIQAHMWYNLAATHSSPSGFDHVVHKVAGVGRDYVARRLTPTQLAEA